MWAGVDKHRVFKDVTNPKLQGIYLILFDKAMERIAEVLLWLQFGPQSLYIRQQVIRDSLPGKVPENCTQFWLGVEGKTVIHQPQPAVLAY